MLRAATRKQHHGFTSLSDARCPGVLIQWRFRNPGRRLAQGAQLARRGPHRHTAPPPRCQPQRPSTPNCRCSTATSSRRASAPLACAPTSERPEPLSCSRFLSMRRASWSARRAALCRTGSRHKTKPAAHRCSDHRHSKRCPVCAARISVGTLTGGGPGASRGRTTCSWLAINAAPFTPSARSSHARSR